MPQPRPLACIIANPTKPALTAPVRRAIGSHLEGAGYRVIWLETRPEETGATQARLAVASGARLVVAAGGDGTVRAVAAGAARTGVEMAILPLGTANLAARNLGLPIGHLPELLTLATSAHARPTDLAWVHTVPWPGINGAKLCGLSELDQASTIERTSQACDASRTPHTPHPITPPRGGWARPTLGAEHACLVVAGIGFDAALVARTRRALKDHLAWGAYAVAALRNLRAPRLTVRVTFDDDVLPRPEMPHGVSHAIRTQAVTPQEQSAHPASATHAPHLAPSSGRRFAAGHPVATDGSPTVNSVSHTVTARCLLVANGGRLPAGITLAPHATMDDGWLDAIAIDVVGGLAGWASLAQQVLPPHPAHYGDPARKLGRVSIRQARTVTIALDAPAPLEIDGELLAPAREVRIRLDAGAVLIRRPSVTHRLTA